MCFKELSYATDADPRLKRWLIRSIEGLSGRDDYVGLYKIWRRDIIDKSDRVFARTLDLIDVAIEVKGHWPLEPVPAEPIVVVANHPFGIGSAGSH
ncbi:putative hemolysin [Rhizobium binae]|uniref:Hemolysin n=1 Tax=Rhizobium binae TaxID=1138190 RepID=A0ABV2MKJ2_9HYPH